MSINSYQTTQLVVCILISIIIKGYITHLSKFHPKPIQDEQVTTHDIDKQLGCLSS